MLSSQYIIPIKEMEEINNLKMKADGFFRLKIYDNALEILDEILRKAKKYNNSELISYTLHNMSAIYSKTMKIKLAIETIEKAIEYGKEENDIDGLSKLYHYLGENLSLNNQFEEAITALLESLKYGNLTKNMLIISNTSRKIFEIYYAHYDSLGLIPPGKMFDMINMAGMLFRRNRHEEGFMLIKECLESINKKISKSEYFKALSIIKKFTEEAAIDPFKSKILGRTDDLLKIRKNTMKKIMEDYENSKKSEIIVKNKISSKSKIISKNIPEIPIKKENVCPKCNFVLNPLFSFKECPSCGEKLEKRLIN